MLNDDWTHYGTHHDALAAEEMRRKARTPGFELRGLFVRLEWLPEHQRQSWQTLADAGVRSFMILKRRETGEIQHWVVKSRRCNIWKNRNHPQFPWEIIIYIKIT